MSGLFVCGSKVILVATQIDDHDDQQLTICVFKVDLDKGLAFEVSRAPNDLRNRFVRDPSVQTAKHHTNFSITCAACHGDSIYIGDNIPSMLYNVTTGEWCDVGEGMPKSDFTKWRWRWTSITYQPGINSLLEG